MNVLSLFDGMSCGQIALNRAGVKYDNYYASEIDKYAMQVTKHNYPNTKQIGDVTQVKGLDLPKIDLLIGGSPCQGFSFAGKQLNFEDERSKLFFEFVRLLVECNPKYFLLENVKMKKEYQDIISEHLGVEPIHINSEVFSAQDRKRSYWTNIEFSALPIENKSTVEDILESEVDIKYCIEPKRSVVILDNEVKKRKIGFIGSDSQGNRIYSIHGKSVCLCGEAGGLGAKTGLYALPCLTPDRTEKRQNGRRFKPPHSKFYTLTTMDKYGVLTSHFIRKLTPLECEKLQNVPENYTQKALNICFQKCYNCGSENDIKEPTVCKFVESKNVISPSQVGKLNSAISTILDLSEMEQQSLVESLSIKVKTVFLKDAEERDKRLQVTASNVIRHGLETAEKLILPVRFAVKRSVTQGGAVYVCDMQPLRRDTEMQTELIKMLCENFSRMDIKEEDITNQKTVAGFIMSLQSKCLAENSEKEKLFTTLIWTNLIIAKAIFMCAKATQPICLCIDSLSKLQGSLLEMELLALKTESITETSNSARYRMLGNGWTVDVIAHILKGMKEA
jgi:DNA-cytosine methyltransferase